MYMYHLRNPNLFTGVSVPEDGEEREVINLEEELQNWIKLQTFLLVKIRISGFCTTLKNLNFIPEGFCRR